MPDPVKIPAPLSTPDPSATTEVIVAYISGIVGNLLIIFGSGLDSTTKTAISATFTGVILLGTLLYSAHVRGSRAKAGGVVGGFLLDVPTTDGNDTDAARKRP